MFQKVKVYVTVFVSLLVISLGLSVKAGAAEDLAVTKTRIVLESYEFGPAVTKVIFEFNQKVTPEAVSYTHLDVYKRQVLKQIQEP